MANLGVPGSSKKPLRLASDRVTTTGKVIDGGMDLTKTASELMKDVAKLMKDVPYLEGIAGIVFGIIKIRDEMKSKKDRGTEIATKVVRRTRTVFYALKRVMERGEQQDGSAIAALRVELEAYQNVLQDIHDRLARFHAKGTFSRILDRDKAPFEECNRLIDDFKDDISLRILADLGTAAAPVRVPAIPPQINASLPIPSKMFGRDAELDMIIRILLHTNRPRLAILGPGGMGKTTLALSAMHNTDTENMYESQYFVSCEACISLEALLSQCADLLGIPAEARGTKLQDMVVARLKQSTPVLLCLDNFETPWFESASKRPFEDFLRHLDSLPNVTILITMRGEERPSGLDWSRPLFPPLTRLAAASMLEVLDQAASGQVDLEDDDIKQLMSEIDGLPLAATLLGHLLRDGIETPASLRRRWGKESTKMLETDESDRLYSLNRSISLSLSSSVMKKCPAARTILSLLAFLPDGFSYSDDLIDRLESHLPEDVDLQAVFSVLRKVALVYIDQTSLRIRILPPIRRFCLSQLPLVDVTQESIVRFYLKLLDDHWNSTVADNYLIIPPEMHNLETTLLQALNHTPDKSVFDAVDTYSWWSMQVGVYSPALVIFARNCSQIQGTQANLCCLEGVLAYRRQDYIIGETAFQSAVAIYQELGDHENEAKALGQLGELYRLQGRLDDAAQVLRDALDLEPTSRYKAELLQHLGHVHLALNLLDDAEKSLRDALPLHQQVQNGVGEANVLQHLGDLHLRRDQLGEAEMFLQDALQLHRQVQSRLGEGTDLQMLGDLHLCRDQLDEAQMFFQNALQLHRQVQDRLGEANDLRMLGDLHLRRDQLDEAETFLQDALQLHRQVQDRLGEATDLQTLGDLHLRRDQLDEAETFLQDALQLHQQVQSRLGEATDLQMLGDLHLRRDQLDEAEMFLQDALQLHRQVQDQLGEANDLKLLADLGCLRETFNTAEQQYCTSLDLFQTAGSIWGEGDAHQGLGELHIKMERFDAALEYLQKASELHGKAGIVHEIRKDKELLEKVRKELNSRSRTM